MTKKTLIIIFGSIILILGAIGIWVFSFLNGSPTALEDRFANFPWGNGNTTEFPSTEIPEITEFPSINVSGAKLRQLTFRPVIGYGEILKNESRHIRYVEAGTGHVYDIDIITGTEERISNIIIANAHRAYVPPNGSHILINNTNSEAAIIDISANEPTSRFLSGQMTNIGISENGHILFTVRSNNGLQARELQIIPNTTRELFSIPFTSATIRWSQNSNVPHLIYTKPASQLLGYVYEINSSNQLRRLPIAGPGLTAIHTGSYILISSLEGTSYKTRIYDPQTQQRNEAPVTIIPEKCVDSNNTFLIYCGSELTTYSYEFPDEWYKGVRMFDDSLWRIDVRSQSATMLINPLSTIGRSLDMTELQLDSQETVIYFINKSDKTLWLYDLTP